MWLNCLPINENNELLDFLFFICFVSIYDLFMSMKKILLRQIPNIFARE